MNRSESMVRGRSPRVIAGALAALVGALGLHAAPANAADPLDTMRRGKEAFASQCLGCHQSVDEAVGEYRARPALEKVVADMVVLGARLDEAQQQAVVEYISGRLLVQNKCRTCHSSNRPLTANKSPEEWRATVERMVSKMPAFSKLKPEQADAISAFLSIERPSR